MAYIVRNILVYTMFLFTVSATLSKLSIECNVKIYGAKGDNKTEDTHAFSSAIKACQGNGTVLVPPGKFLLRPLQLLSNTCLVISPKAILVAWSGVGWQHGWPNSTKSTCSASPYEDPHPIIVPRLQSFLSAADVENVTIRGGGTVDGQGWRWWPMKKKSEYWHHCRPLLIDISTAMNLVIDNITLYNSMMFNIHAHNVKTARITHVNITTDGCGYSEAPNTDGINLSGDNIYVADCKVRNGDDCIPINKNTSNMLVERIYCECGNGVVPIIWHNTSGYIRNVTFRNVTFSKTNLAITIKSLPSYIGTVEDVIFENMILDNVSTAIDINAYGQSNNVGSEAGLMHVSNITMRNIRGTAKTAGKFNCLQCTDITMRNVVLSTEKGYSCKGANGTAEGCKPKPCLE